MFSLTVPFMIRKVADRFKSTVDMPFGSLCTLFALHLFGAKSLSEAVRTLAWSPSVSSLDLAVQGFSSNRFMRRMRTSILKKYKDKLNSEDFCYAIDDVPVERFGKKMFRTYPWRGHGKMTRGQRILVIALVDRKKGTAIPLAYEVCTQKKDGENHVKSTERAVNLVFLILEQGFPSNLPVVFDSWFDSVEMMKKLDEMKVTFVIEAKSNRVVKKSPTPKARWHTWNKILDKGTKQAVKFLGTANRKKKLERKYVAETRVFIRERDKMLKAAAVYNKKTDSDFFAIYVSNDLSLSGGELWGYSRSRWHIEEMFRTLKQDFSFGKLPVTGESGTEVSVCFPFVLLVLFQTEKEEWTSRNKVTIGSMVKEFREEEFMGSIDKLTKRPGSLAVLKLRSRRRVERNNKKPINPTANDIMEWRMQAA